MATITLNLNDQVSNNLDLINQNLDQMAADAEQAAKSINILDQSMVQNNTTIVEARKGWADLGSVAVSTFGDISIAAIREGGSVIKWAIGSKLAMEGLRTVFGTTSSAAKQHFGVMEAASAGWLATQAAATAEFLKDKATHRLAWLGVEKAAEAAGSASVAAVARLTPVLAGAAVALKAHQTMLENTGERMEIFTKSLGSQTLKQAQALKEFEADAKRLGVTIGQLAEMRGREVNKDSFFEKEFGVEVTRTSMNNIDRVNEAWGKFASDATRDTSRLFSGWTDLIQAPQMMIDAWKELDADYTRRTDFEVQNINTLREGFTSLTQSIRSYTLYVSESAKLGGRSYDAIQKETEAVDEMTNAWDRHLKRKDKEASSWEMTRVANEELAANDRARAEQKRLLSIATVKGIDEEIEAVKKRRIELNQQGKFDEEEKNKYVKQMEWLRDRRIKVAENIAAEEKKKHEEAKQRHIEQMRIMDEEMAKHNAVYAAEKKRREDAGKRGKELGYDLQDQQSKNAVARAKEQLETEKAITAEKMKAGGAKEAEVKAQMAKMDTDFAKKNHAEKLKQIDTEAQRKLDAIQAEREKNEKFGGTAAERALADSKLKADADKVMFDRRRARIAETGDYQRDMIDRESNKFREAQLEMFRAEQERIEKVKSLASGQFDAKAMMQSSDPTKVMKSIQDERARKAMDSQADKDVDLINAMNDGMGPESPAERRARRQYERNQKVAESKARRSVVSDAENGNLQQSEVELAQMRVASSTIQAFGQQNQANDMVLKTLIDSFKTMEAQQQALMNFQTVVAQIQNAQKGLTSAAKKSAQFTQAQIGMIGQ